MGAEWAGGLSKQELGGTGLIAVASFLVGLMNYGRDGNGYSSDEVKKALEYILFGQDSLVTRDESDRLKSERLQEFLTKMLSERRR